MKTQWITGLAIVLVLSLAAGSVWAGEKECPPPDAEEVWEWVTESDPYQGWGYWPEHDGMYPGQSPHGAYLKLYANSIALKALREGKQMPPGSMIMKANYGKDKETLMALTPMYKVEGYNPEAGNWFWAKYKPDGEVEASGKVEGCIDCHRAQKDNDWIFTSTEPE
ncbi:MAG: cytochrome P460 family protein [Desulfohalobiaceae bacterium]|nr:cytochrome P460 family protein [Desulfohalobiaceae bacterium]